MMENLPPPNWSPTGESGYWVWSEQGQAKKTLNGEIIWEPKWKWFTDEEYEKYARGTKAYYPE